MRWVCEVFEELRLSIAKFLSLIYLVELSPGWELDTGSCVRQNSFVADYAYANVRSESKR